MGEDSSAHIVEQIKISLGRLKKAFDDFKKYSLKDGSSDELRARIDAFENVFIFHKKAERDMSLRQFICSANGISIRAGLLLNVSQGEMPSIQLSDAKRRISEAVDGINDFIKDKLFSYEFSPDYNGLEENQIDSAHSREFKSIQIVNAESRKLIGDTYGKVHNLQARVKDLESLFEKELKKVQDLYDSSLIELEKKKSTADELLGIISGKSVAGNFEKSAATEKGVADNLRIASLVLMAIIILFVAYSFYQTIGIGFNWESSLYRLIFSIFLSIPAAYLARESTKHRVQQYSHLQTALDLKAIDPYIASLPEKERFHLKSSIAGRLFVGFDGEKTSSESYPLNIHELLMTIIGKMEFKDNKNDR